MPSMSYESTVSGSETELRLWEGKWLGNVPEDKDYVYVEKPDVTDSEDSGLEDDEGPGTPPSDYQTALLQYELADFEFEPPRPATPSDTSDDVQLDQELGSTEQDSEDEESPDTILTEDQIDLLDEFIARFKKVNVPEKTNIIQEAADAIERNWEEEASFNREAVETAVGQYLYNNTRRGYKNTFFSIRSKWTLRQVVKVECREEINKLAAKLSSSPEGSTKFITWYQKAVSKVVDDLSEEMREKYQALAKIWTEQAPPRAVQQRMCKKNGPRALQEFARSAYTQLGMRIAVFAAYRDTRGEPTVTLFDINDELGGRSFKDTYENWTEVGMAEDFSKWANESMGAAVAPSNDGPSARPKKLTLSSIKLNTDPNDGHPILPSWDKIEPKELLYKKLVIGKFTRDTYRISVGNSKGRIPWSVLREAQDDFIENKYLPGSGFRLTQYHKISLSKVNRLLKHWTDRQEAGEIPFRFKNVANLKAGRRGEEASTDTESDGSIPELSPGPETVGKGLSRAAAKLKNCKTDFNGGVGNDLAKERERAQDREGGVGINPVGPPPRPDAIGQGLSGAAEPENRLADLDGGVGDNLAEERERAQGCEGGVGINPVGPPPRPDTIGQGLSGAAEPENRLADLDGGVGNNLTEERERAQGCEGDVRINPVGPPTHPDTVGQGLSGAAEPKNRPANLEGDVGDDLAEERERAQDREGGVGINPVGLSPSPDTVVQGLSGASAETENRETGSDGVSPLQNDPAHQEQRRCPRLNKQTPTDNAGSPPLRSQESALNQSATEENPAPQPALESAGTVLPQKRGREGKENAHSASDKQRTKRPKNGRGAEPAKEIPDAVNRRSGRERQATERAMQMRTDAPGRKKGRK